ncbi:hypothetical protein KNV66_gp50 [Bacillus phage DLc1]|uniref:Uncharacterized protein n=1 Tax=Bacillus phage DLc1 TaxID=2777318 RepID=A0A7M1RPB6_9CAUD|nr:hypothetical protein KNV66_gp50 [Bacillus phage DLc1]QOR56253.1 hypothetical protein [Bacillus phage DLc1]
MEFTVEENKKRQQDVGVRYIDKKSIKLHINIYKMGRVKDIKELTFSNKEMCMIHVENLIKTTDYNLTSFSNEFVNGTERFFITLKK